jgi:hypothetical protein
MIQCMVRTQAGWIVFTPSCAAWVSAAARLDILGSFGGSEPAKMGHGDYAT